MQITLQKGEHKALLRNTGKLVSLVSWSGFSRTQNITGMRTEYMGSEKEATVLFRKMSNLMQSNGYNLLRQ